MDKPIEIVYDKSRHMIGIGEITIVAIEHKIRQRKDVLNHNGQPVARKYYNRLIKENSSKVHYVDIKTNIERDQAVYFKILITRYDTEMGRLASRVTYTIITNQKVWYGICTSYAQNRFEGVMGHSIADLIIPKEVKELITEKITEYLVGSLISTTGEQTNG